MLGWINSSALGHLISGTRSYVFIISSWDLLGTWIWSTSWLSPSFSVRRDYWSPPPYTWFPCRRTCWLQVRTVVALSGCSCTWPGPWGKPRHTSEASPGSFKIQAPLLRSLGSGSLISMGVLQEAELRFPSPWFLKDRQDSQGHQYLSPGLYPGIWPRATTEKSLQKMASFC